MQEFINKDEGVLKKLTDVILANLENENFGVKDLAHESGMSLYSLSRKLNSLTRKKISQFIREVRLKKSLEILSEENYTASEVAYKVGFSSPAYFNKCFHEYFGYTPGEVGKNTLKNAEQGNQNLIPERDIMTRSFFLSLPGILSISLIPILIAVAVYFNNQKSGVIERLRSSGGRISVAVMPFRNMTNDTTLNIWQEGLQLNLISSLSNAKELKVKQEASIRSLLQSRGITDNASIPPSIAMKISRKLNADIFISGNFQKAGSAIRLNALLIDNRSRDIIKAFEIKGPYKGDVISELADTLRKKITEFLVISNLIKDDPGLQHGFTQPTSSEALRAYLYGDKAHDRGDFASAIDWGLKALAIDSNFTLAAFLVENSYAHSDSSDQSLRWLINDYKKREQMSNVDRIYASWAYAFTFESPEQQIRYLNQLLDIDDQQPNIHYLIGLTYKLAEQYEKAIPEFLKAHEIYDSWGNEYRKNFEFTELGTAYRKTGQFSKAKKLFSKAEKAYPEDHRWHYYVLWHQALLLFEVKDTISANKYIARMIAYFHKNSYPESRISWSMGNLYEHAGFPDKATEYFRNAISLDPENATLLRRVAESYINNNHNLNDVPALMDKAMDLSTNKTDYYNYMNVKGWAFYKQGNYKEAMKIFQETWDFAPYKKYSFKVSLDQVKATLAGL